MNLELFLQQRRQSWQRLEHLLTQTHKRERRLTASELEEFGRLYRAATADLALAQRDYPGQTVSSYLNQLVARAHAELYQGEPLRWRQLRRFYAATFAQLYRKIGRYTTVAFVLFALPALAALFVIWADPTLIAVIEGPEIAGLVEEVKQGKLWTEIDPAARSAASGLIMTNNLRVLFLTFAGGITAGLLTAWVMIVNGLHLGAIFGLLLAYDMAAGLAEFVVAHGFIELSVIFLAGGCGLYMGDALLRPGLLSRRQALVQRARISVQLILGCAPLMVVAGLIEGFISPSALPWPVKLGVGVATGAALHWYWLRVGRGEQL